MSSINDENNDSSKLWQNSICCKSQLFIDLVFSAVKQFILIGVFFVVGLLLSKIFKEHSSSPFCISRYLKGIFLNILTLDKSAKFPLKTSPKYKVSADKIT